MPGIGGALLKDSIYILVLTTKDKKVWTNVETNYLCCKRFTTDIQKLDIFKQNPPKV